VLLYREGGSYCSLPGGGCVQDRTGTGRTGKDQQDRKGPGGQERTGRTGKDQQDWNGPAGQEWTSFLGQERTDARAGKDRQDRKKRAKLQ